MSELNLDKCKAAFVILSDEERKHFIQLAMPMAGIDNNTKALTEHLRLKEEENQQLQQDNAKLREAIALVNIANNMSNITGWKELLESMK